MKFGAREVLFLLIMVGLLFSAWYFVFKNADERIKQLNDDTREKQGRLLEVKTAASRIHNMSQKIEELQQQIRMIEAKLPRERDTREIVQQIDVQARSYKQLAVLKMLAPKPEKAANYFEQPVKLTMKGDFRSFYQFMLKVEQLTRITRVNQMKLSKINESDGAMTADLTLSIYFAPDTTAK